MKPSQQIVKKLVELASEDKIPLDMNELSPEHFNFIDEMIDDLDAPCDEDSHQCISCEGYVRPGALDDNHECKNCRNMCQSCLEVCEPEELNENRECPECSEENEEDE